MPHRAPVLAIAVSMATFLTATSALAQASKVELPSSTASLTATPEWTVLMPNELAQEIPATNLTSEDSRTWLMSCVAELKAQERTDQHVLLYRLGNDPDQLQLVNAYSDDVSTTSSDLLNEEAIAQMSTALVEEASTPDRPLKYYGHDIPDMYNVEPLLLHLAPVDDQSMWRMSVMVVPAGSRLQYFECQYRADDPTAKQSIQTLLRTFDGAKEPDSSISNLLIASLAGATAGILTALLRRRRQLHTASRLTQSNS